MKFIYCCKLVVIISLNIWMSGCGLDQTRYRQGLSDDKYLLFLGNPGVGKTAMINALLGQKKGSSGINFVGSKTLKSQIYEDANYKYIDTPGLSNTYKMQTENAAREIEKALKNNAKYSIFFIITLEGEHVRDADVHDMNVVIDSIKAENKNFAVIVNKINSQQMLGVWNDFSKRFKIIAKINSGKYKTTRIWYNEYDYNFYNGKSADKLIAINDVLKNFIYDASAFFPLSPEQVGNISTYNIR